MTRVAVPEFGAPEPATPQPGELPAPGVWQLTAPEPGQPWLLLADGWISRSADGGINWQQVDIPTYDQIVPGGYGLGPIVFLDAKTAVVAGRAGVVRSDDSGAHWQTIILQK